MAGYPPAAFALSENTRAFLPVLKQAVLRRGYCERLYVDNGANYRSRHVGLVCAKLGIVLIHARPYRPQGYVLPKNMCWPSSLPAFCKLLEFRAST